MRRAIVSLPKLQYLTLDDRDALIRRVQRYLPSNYAVTDVTVEGIVIEGEDRAGWTLDGYVIPRLASGLIRAEER